MLYKNSGAKHNVNVIMRSVKIFSVHYETVAGQIRLWCGAAVKVNNGKHWSHLSVQVLLDHNSHFVNFFTFF